MWNFLLFVGLLATPPGPPSTPCFGAWTDQALPAELEWASDLRRTDQSEPFLWLSPTGLWQSSAEATKPSLIAGRGTSRIELFVPTSLASSAGRTVVGSAAYSFSEIDVGKKTLRESYVFWSLVDLDLRQGKIALFGAQRSADDQYAADGALAFWGPLGSPVESLRPLYFSEQGPGAEAFAKCSLLEISHLRFLDDGSLVLVPGVEAGVFFYRPDGQLARSFSAAEVGFESGCGLDAAAARKLALDEPARWAWVNQRRVVDDIVPLTGGAALLLRQVQAGRPSWQLKLLRLDGSIRTCDLPIATRDPLARLKADSQGEVVHFLLSHRGYAPYPSWQIDQLTGARQDFPAKLHPDEPARWLSARYLP